MSEDEPNDQDDGTGNDGAQSPEVKRQNDGQQGQSDAKNAGQKRKGIIKGRLRLPSQSKEKRAKIPSVSAGKSTADTFRTAEEFPNKAGPSTPRRNPQDALQSTDYSPVGTEQSAESSGGHTDAHASHAKGVTDGVDSTSSLIPHGKDDEGKSAKGDPTQASKRLEVTVTAATGDGPEDDRSEQRETDPRTILEQVEHPRASGDQARLDIPPEHQDGGHPSLQRLDPVSTGLVRFNLPADDPIADKQGARKISEARIIKSIRDLSKARAQPGQLLKAERMLVRVEATRSEVPAGYTENDSLGIETRLLEKWREFIVVCRRSTEPQPDSELVLRMETTRVIPVLEDARSPKKAAHEIPLSHKNARINMYSSLDKTIVIWAPYKKETRIYLFRPRSFASSVEWYTFLHTALGWKRSPSVAVHVPCLNMTVEIEKPFEELKISDDAAHNEDVDGGSGDAVAKREAEGQAAQLIIDRSLEMLKNSPAEDVLKTWVQHEERIGLAWKRYDRLEWVHGANEERMYGSIAMSQTHDLELRPKTHYPTQTHPAPHQNPPVEEPPAVEGFLVRLTSQRGLGSRFGRQFSKRLYYATHNQYFCFSTPGQVVPPKPPNLRNTRSGQMPTSSEIAEKIPLVYMVDPYPLEDGKISWLSNREARRIQECDQAAYEESERTVKALMEADGYINLCHVVGVHRSREGTTAPPAQEDGARDSLDTEDTPSDDETQPTDHQAIFELTMRNGLVVRLQAYSQEARKEWVKRLRGIAKYWRMRMAEDMFLYQTVRQTNLQRLDIDEGMEAYLGQYAQRWEVARAVTSPELFNVCGISCCRAVTMAGVLYHKPRLHGTFKKCNVLLVHGRLLIFQATLRSRSGKEIPHIHYERQEALDLRDTYVYSGLVRPAPFCHSQSCSSHPKLPPC